MKFLAEKTLCKKRNLFYVSEKRKLNTGRIHNKISAGMAIAILFLCYIPKTPGQTNKLHVKPLSLTNAQEAEKQNE